MSGSISHFLRSVSNGSKRLSQRLVGGYPVIVPYELSFTASLTDHPDPSIYVNDCCWGGDVIRDRLLPVVSGRYQELFTEQEDWGWFLWFQDGATRLAIDIFCDDIPGRKFRIRLTSQRKRFLFLSAVTDTPELDRLRDVVVVEITRWAETPTVERVGSD